MQKYVNTFMINFAIKSSFICVLYLVLFNVHYILTILWVGQSKTALPLIS